MAAKKAETQAPLNNEVEAIEGSPTTIATTLFKTFLQFADVVGAVQALRFEENGVSFRSRNKGNTSMCIITLNNKFHNTGEVGVNVDQLLSAMPKTDTVTISIGEKICVEGTDYKANFLIIGPKDPDLAMSKLKKDFAGSNGFVVGSKDFCDKVVSLKSVFKGDPFLALVSDAKEPGIMTLTTDDNSVGDVHYRVVTSSEVGETWTRSYDYDILIPILKNISQYCQEVKLEWLKLGEDENLAALVLSGSTPDGAITFSHALAPRIPIDKE